MNTGNFFQNPFMSLSNTWLPTSMNEVFQLCEWMYRYNGLYRAALERAARLFFTNVTYDTKEEISSLSTIKDYISKFTDQAIKIGIDYLVYGNSICTIYLPFRRQVKCPLCNKEYAASLVTDLSYNRDGYFNGTCPNRACGTVSFTYKDTPDKNINSINVIRINPKEVEMIYNKFSGNATYFWNISTTDKNRIQNGSGTLLVYETPIEILDAIHTDGKLKLNNSNVLHMSQPTIAGLSIEWGTPFSLSCFPLVFYIAILRKANEAISMDYIVPLRIIYPTNTTSYQEASYMNLGKFKSQVDNIIRHHKIDPLDWNVSPTQLGYQIMGGEKRSLMISDDIDLSNKELLNSIGFPAEFFYGSMGLQAAPMALRLMDNTFGLTCLYNRLLRWILDRVSSYIGIDRINAEVQPLKWVDDIERRNMAAQLASADKISDIDFLELYGFDYEKVQRRKMEQRMIINKLEKEYAKKQIIEQQQSEESAMLGSPEQLQQHADSIASQLAREPQNVVDQELRNLMSQNKALHDLVRMSLERERNKMRSEGYNMILQQSQGQPQQMQ